MFHKKRLPCCLGLLWLFGATCFLPAAAANFRFQPLTVDDGLSQNTIGCILQDRQGFIWFGTEEGLNRYDGISFKVYRRSQSGRNSLSHDRVSAMVDDDQGIFWIGTLGGGLNRFDPVRETFSVFRFQVGQSRSLSQDSIRCILKGKGGILWIGTDNGLNRFDSRSGLFTRYMHGDGRQGYDQANAFNCLHQDDEGRLWCGTQNGLSRFDPGEGTFTRFHGQGQDAQAVKRNQINALFEDAKNVLWLGSEGGLGKFDRQDNRLVFVEETDVMLSHLYRSRIQAISGDHQGRIWIGTEAGLYIFPRHDNFPVYFRAAAVAGRYLKDMFITTFFQDRAGMTWIGTFSGIFKYDPRIQQFDSYSEALNMRDGDFFKLPIFSIGEDRRGTLWIGTYKHGLVAFNPGTDEKKVLTSLPGNPVPLRDQTIPALLIDRSNRLWIGTSHGLHLYRINEDKFAGYFQHRETDGGISNDAITSLYEDHSGRLWIGTEDGLNLFDPIKGVFRVFRKSASSARIFGDNYIMAVLQDRRGQMWVGTYGGGLSRFQPETGQFHTFRHQEGDPASLSNDKIYCLFEDSQGILWIGTNSGGLNRFDPRLNTFSTVTTEQGLPNNIIMGILPDRRGCLWLATNRGLSRYDTRNGSFKNFTSSDGLQDNEFLPRAFFKNSQGEMFFGGINGLTAFYPENIMDNPFVPPLVITSVSIHRRNLVYTGNLSYMKALTLHYKDAVVSFAFAALSYSNPQHNRYAYRIDGLNDHWIEIGNRHEIVVSNLRPGHYVLRVKGSNNDGIWNEEGVTLAITVKPPWWQTWWFKALALIMVILVFVQWYRTRMKRMAARIRTEAAMEQFFGKYDISQREREIVLLLLKGKSNKEIEDELFIAMGTVKNHVYNIYQKVGVKNRAQLMALFKNLQVR